MPYPLYLYIAGLAFLVSSTDPNKQLFNVKFVFESLNHAFNMSERYRLITFFRERNTIVYQRVKKKKKKKKKKTAKKGCLI